MESLATQDGRTLTYHLVGEGPALVCHPGGPGFSSRYFGDLAGLTQSLTLVLLDPRGTGASDRPSDARGYRTEDYAADLDELRAHLGLEQMQLLGHSHGGVVATAYAGWYPHRVERLVLASTLVRFQAEQEGAMKRAMEAKSTEPWYADARTALEAEQAGKFETDEELAALAFREFPFYFARYGDDERAYLEELADESPNADALRLFNNEIFPSFDLRPELARIDAPTLVIAGEDDFITGPVCADELEAGIAGVEKVILANAGHFIFVEARDAFREAVLSFLGARV
jgi:proline-specific peptidase